MTRLQAQNFYNTRPPVYRGNKACVLHAQPRPVGRKLVHRAICVCSSNESRANEYIGSDGRRKSTIEEAFAPTNTAFAGNESECRSPPWGIGWQTSEQSIEWNDDLKQRLLQVLHTLLGYPSSASDSDKARQYCLACSV